MPDLQAGLFYFRTGAATHFTAVPALASFVRCSVRPCRCALALASSRNWRQGGMQKHSMTEATSSRRQCLSPPYFLRLSLLSLILAPDRPNMTRKEYMRTFFGLGVERQDARKPATHHQGTEERGEQSPPSRTCKRSLSLHSSSRYVASSRLHRGRASAHCLCIRSTGNNTPAQLLTTTHRRPHPAMIELEQGAETDGVGHITSSRLLQPTVPSLCIRSCIGTGASNEHVLRHIAEPQATVRARSSSSRMHIHGFLMFPEATGRQRRGMPQAFRT